MRIHTIGHSNQTSESFLASLSAHRVTLVVDVRRFPSSRRHPQFGAGRLKDSLEAAGIGYLHEPELGGHRTAAPDSHNTAIREDAFRGYADYMETPAFARAIDRLLEVAAGQTVAVMCAERAWRDCHRGLIADYLKARGHDVVHIVSEAIEERHPYTKVARLVDGELSYRGLL